MQSQLNEQDCSDNVMSNYSHKLRTFIIQNDHYCLALTVLCIWCFVYREYFLFDRLFVFGSVAADTFNQFYPIEYFRISNLKEVYFPFWSFQFGLGANVFPEMLNTSPVELIYLLFNNSAYIDAVPVVIFLKFLASALIFHAFLKKIGLSTSVSYVGAIMYSFSGYMILSSHWYHYLNYALFAALFLYLFEVWYQDKYWFPLVILIGLVPLKREIQLFQIAFFGFFYVAYRYINDFGYNKKIFTLYAKLAAIFIFGLFLGSFFYFSDINTFLSSSRIHSSFQDVTFHGTSSFFTSLNNFLSITLRAISPDVLYPWFSYHGERNYFEQSTAYVGSFIFIVFLCSCFIKNKNHKFLWIFFAVLVAIVLVPWLSLTLNMFVSGSLKYLSLYFSFYILFPSLIILNFLTSSKNKSKFNIGILFFCSLLALALLFNTVWSPYFNLSKNVLSYSLLFVCLGALCVLCWSKGFNTFKYVLFVVLIIEIIFVSRQTVGTAPGSLEPFFYARGEYYFNTATRSAIQFLSEKDQTFYRVEKGYRDVYLNDSLVQNYFGTESYLGFAAAGMRNFFYNFHLSENSPNLDSYRYGLEKKSDLQSLLGVKYFLCRDEVECSGLNNFSFLASVGDVRIYLNDKVQPFGQVFYQQISPQAFQRLAPNEQLALVADTVVSAHDIPGIPSYGAAPAAEESSRKGEGGFTLSSWNQQYFSGSIVLDRPGILFFPVPFDRGWQLKANGKQEPLLQLDFGFSGVFLSSPGDYVITLHYRPPFLLSGLGVTCICLALACYLRRRFPKFAAV